MVRGFHRAAAHTNRYGRYAGGPDPLAPPVPVQEALEAIGRDVMSGTSAERAMREYLRRGTRDQQGLDDLARRVRERRAELVRRHRLDGTLEEVRKLLDHAVLEERKHLVNDVDLDDDARVVRRDAAREPARQHRGRRERPDRLRVAAAPRRAPTTSASRSCSAASCSTSGSPA